MTVALKRVYEPVSDDDGLRVLVDRLWPRGISKTDPRVGLWLKDVAPSSDLRKWFDHDPDKWDAFKARYFRELDAQPDAVQRLTDLIGQQRVTLVYGSRNTTINQAVALKQYLDQR